MADGFAGVTFGVLASKPGESARADYTTVHIPYGSTNYVDVGGALPLQMTLTVKLADSTAYSSLQALVGTQGSLTENNVSHVNALLASLDRTAVTRGGIILADAVFVVP